MLSHVLDVMIDASMRPRFFKRGKTPIRLWTNQAIRASMRPRFFKRGKMRKLLKPRG